MAEKRKMPEIRFNGFEGEWEEAKLKELIQYIVDNRGKNPPYYCNDGIPIIDNYMIKNSSYPNLKEANRFIDDYLFENFIRKQNEVDDILITLVGNGIGNITFFPNKKSVIIQNTLGLRFSNDKKFMFFSLLSKNKDILSLNRGMAQPSIRQDELLDLELELPTEPEQTQIGTYFQNLDSLIALHQQKYNKLLTVKKAMLEKMFPKEGADVPEIRFKGFEGKWYEKTLGVDIADIIGGGTPSTFEQSFWNGNIDWYAPTEIGKNVFASGSEKKISELGLKNCSAKFLPADKTILFTSRAGIGDMAILKKTGTTNQGFQSLVLKENYNTYFIYSMGHLIKTFALKNSSGSTFLEISGKVLGKMILLVPPFEEQTKIGTFFRNLDTLISQHQKELEKLKNLKKACLEKMFV